VSDREGSAGTLAVMAFAFQINNSYCGQGLLMYLISAPQGMRSPVWSALKWLACGLQCRNPAEADYEHGCL